MTRCKLNCEALQNSTTRKQFQTTLENAFSDTAEDPPPTQTSNREQFSAVVRSAAEETIEDICKLVAEKNNAHNDLVRNPSSASLRQRLIDLRSFTQRELRIMKSAWWTDLAAEILRYADDNNTHDFYNSIKKVYGPTTRSIAAVRSMDGRMFIKDAEGISHR